MQFFDFDRTAQDAASPYFAAQNLHISDFSKGFQFMWYEALKPAFAITENCLVIREHFAGKCYFHYPLSLTGDRAEELRAVKALETHCRDQDIRLHFTNVPASRVADMVSRYSEALVTNNRRWRDYLYRAEDFAEFPGKKYAGQRNHVRKFERSFPDWQFFEASPSDMGGVKAFLEEYEGAQRGKKDQLADEEMDEVYALLPHLFSLGLFAGILTAGGKIVGFSAGERCGDMVVVHIEKALRSCEGAYPMLAQQFAKKFCTEGVRYLNRMDDAGDLGLRKSKLQYGPCEIVEKYNVIPRRAIDLVFRLPTVKTERLTLAPVRDEDAATYAMLASDVVRNRYWGYDWRTDRKRRPSDAWFLRSAREDFSARREMPLGIYLGETLIGEAVLHRFGYTAEAEVGVRLLAPFEGMGYASEAVRAYSDYAFSKLNIERVEAKCYKANARSRAMLVRAGMRETGADDTFYYFLRNAEM